MIDKKTEKEMAAKAMEAVSLILLVKPLLKRAGCLTAAEQEMMCETIHKSSGLLHDALAKMYAADRLEREKAVSLKKV